MFDHLQACEYCPKYERGNGRCEVYDHSWMWINRRGGCPMFPYRPVPKSRGEYVDGKIVGGKRVGQQHQKKADRKYDNSKARRKFG